ncbi:autotransporter adhesin BpaC-like [Macrobrachium rosenbergii]|uniref:autotransporter adhesin BpaC-like n=1 Tax=Macrobrachium rosenbergii TaxID=79674 RepID=UPI0034D3F7B8
MSQAKLGELCCELVVSSRHALISSEAEAPREEGSATGAAQATGTPGEATGATRAAEAGSITGAAQQAGASGTSAAATGATRHLGQDAQQEWPGDWSPGAKKTEGTAGANETTGMTGASGTAYRSARERTVVGRPCQDTVLIPAWGS